MRKVVLLFASLLMWIGCALGQQRTVTGVVTAVDDGQPMVQLAVQLKGTQTGVVTDANGRYTIRVAGPESVLVFTYTGYETQEITVGEQQTINVVMQLANEEIDEVMVVAFGKAKKSTFTGSAASVSGKDLERKQVSNVLNALSGKVPGVTVSSSNNQPGTSSTIRIRGNGSFSAKSDPLYVVDGVPYEGDISAINPADVESTVLLKDAASAALYGARAANGVVMITTKSGANARSGGSMNVNVTAKVGYNFRGIPDYDKITDPKEYAAKYYEAVWNGQRYAKVNEGKDDEDINGLADKAYFHKINGIVYFPFSRDENSTAPWFTRNGNGYWEMDKNATVGAIHKGSDGEDYWMQPDDWNKEAFEPNMRQEYTVSLSGRTEKANYFFSSGYLNDKGYTVRSSFERFTTRLRGDYKPKTWLSMGANISYTGYKTNSLSATTTASAGSSGNIFAMTNYAAPIYPIYVRDKNKNKLKNKWNKWWYDFGTGEFPGLSKRPYLSVANPLAANTYDIYDRVAGIIGVRSNVDFIMPYGFRFSIVGGYDLDDTYATSSLNTFYGQYAPTGGEISKTFQRESTLNLQQLLTWNQTYGENHIDVLLGHEYYDRDEQYLNGNKQGMFHYNARELDQAIRQPQTSSNRHRYRVEGFLGRAQYDWAEKYFLTLSFRRDGSSRFAEKNRWGNFGSVGASWMLSNESFMESTRSFLDLLKVKASYGVQGNDNMPEEVEFAYLDLYKLSNNNGAYATSFFYKGNENITWETSHNINFGIEYAFFRHRLTGNIEFYRRNVTDMLFQLTVPGSAGYRYFWDNVGSMSNTGMEFEITGVPYQDKDIRWSVTVNGGIVKNKLEKLPDEWKKTEWGYVSGSVVYKEGGSLYDYFIPKFKGLDEEGRAQWQTYNKTTGEYGVTTDYTEASKNENRVLYKDMSSFINGGFSTNVDFWGFDFSAAFTYSLGGKRFDYVYQDLMHGGSDNGRAFHKDLLNSWTPQKKNTDIPRMDVTTKQSNGLSDFYFTSRSYLAIDNLTLGYTFPKAWLDKINLGSLRVYVVADNVWLFSARKGFDPRFTTPSGVGYKAIRSVSAGLNLTF